MLADRTAASAGLPPPRACKQRSWDLQLADRGENWELMPSLSKRMRVRHHLQQVELKLCEFTTVEVKDPSAAVAVALT